MYRIQVYMGKGRGWKWGLNTYTLEQLTLRIIALQKVGIKFRVDMADAMFKD